MKIFIDLVALAKQGDNALGSVHLSTCLFGCLSVLFCTSSWVKVDCHMSDECLCFCNQGAFADNLTDAVGRLLIIKWNWLSIWKLRALRNLLN